LAPLSGALVYGSVPQNLWYNDVLICQATQPSRASSRLAGVAAIMAGIQGAGIATRNRLSASVLDIGIILF
jgi:hypothetical protein